MTQKEKIQQEIEKTLGSLDGVTRAVANPFLFTRIKAKMDKKPGVWEQTFSFISKPVIAIAMLVLIMAVNGWVLWDGSGSQANLTADTNNVSELANEYNMVASVSNYDYENMSNE